MDLQGFIKKYPFLKRNLIPIVLGFFGLIFLGYGLIALIGASKSSSDVIFESSEDSNLSSGPASPKSPVRDIVVDVEGAVLKPGVHYVSSDSRVQDALIAAGGLSSDADRDWVTKNLNLAVKVTDGTKIYIPRIGEDVKGAIGGTGITSTTGSIADSQVNINTASDQALDSLSGIGPVTAQKIINGRPYSSIDELLSRKIVGSKVFEQIKEKITAY
jgi:competence protein ComEA